MKTRILFICLTLLSLKGFSDSAMPGVWVAGGTRKLTLLYPEDSIAYNKIQMKKELVSIQLYKGYAVVKGEYWMYNDTKDTFRIKTGYPLNSESDGKIVQSMLFDSLSQLQVLVDGQPAKIISAPINFTDTVKKNYEYLNWYVWLTTFKPKGYTKIDVYFIVNTNYASITGGGYNRADYNGFIYILESGSTWKQPIEQGAVIVQLMDDIKIADIHGVNPQTIFAYNEPNQLLKYTFNNLSPTPDNNIIITYSNDLSNFDFGAVVKNKQSCFKAIDSLSHINLAILSFKPMSFNYPTHIPHSGVNPLILFFGLCIGGVFLVIVIIIIAIILIRKRLKK
jgi:hypothetical protein